MTERTKEQIIGDLEALKPRKVELLNELAALEAKGLIGKSFFNLEQGGVLTITGVNSRGLTADVAGMTITKENLDLNYTLIEEDSNA